MIEALEKAFQDAQALPEPQQQQVADLIEELVADMRWDELLESPKSVKMLDEMAAKALSDLREGRTSRLTFDIPRDQ